MEQLVEFIFFKKFKSIASLPILHSYFRLFLKKKKDFPENPITLGNLVLITPTVHVELSKLNFSFDDI